MAKMFRVLGKMGRITIPYEIRKRVGFARNDVLSFTEAEDGRTVVVRREKLCDGCPEVEEEGSMDAVTLQDFLDGLTEKEQRAALLHLSVRWAERQEARQEPGRMGMPAGDRCL